MYYADCQTHLTAYKNPPHPTVALVLQRGTFPLFYNLLFSVTLILRRNFYLFIFPINTS